MATTMASATHGNRPAFKSPVSWPLLLALAVLALPTVITLGEQVWSKESGAHGPIVLVTGLWLLWRKLPDMREAAKPGAWWLTTLMLAVALPIYVFGRAYDFISLEVAGLYGAGVAMMHARFGVQVLLKNWFPLFYLAFLIPPPGWLMDGITAPLKLFVSYVTTGGLQLVGIPVFREGVTLMIGPYQLLVEDACSGMNSMTGLVAISLFYIYLLRNASWRYSLFLVLLVIPIAVIANIIRVATLVLLTHFFGDAVAQGFLHMAAGLLLFTSALLLVFLVDNLMSYALRKWGKAA
ncbi:exosortase V [Phenylobacterium sp.]|uniref:exosortase V n=1 Tax=Phenylobacterium sp. TaxID=1871053 RepID=UPI00273026A4|nr:exosortase V [Phenylobacterium sp.]MDP1598216.1 exosortase V [Phenylobacterium sp.]MDP3594720.1 exosortase V [Phenylobacterium sp.]